MDKIKNDKRKRLAIKNNRKLSRIIKYINIVLAS